MLNTKEGIVREWELTIEPLKVPKKDKSQFAGFNTL
jgi:hypothetical protein